MTPKMKIQLKSILNRTPRGVWLAAAIVLVLGLRMGAARSSSLKFRTLREMKPQTSLARWEAANSTSKTLGSSRAPASTTMAWQGPGEWLGSLSDGRFTITLNDADWFSTGTAQITSKGLAEAGRFAATLKKLPIDWSKAQIQVEGHSDSAPVVKHRDTYPTNWELSGSRAFTLVRLLELQGFPRERLAGIGYADTRNRTSIGNSSGRRLTVTVSVDAPAETRMEVAQH